MTKYFETSSAAQKTSILQGPDVMLSWPRVAASLSTAAASEVEGIRTQICDSNTILQRPPVKLNGLY